MKEVLLKKLIESNLFANGTEIELTYKGLDWMGRTVDFHDQAFTVTGLFITKKTNRVKMDAESIVAGSRVRVSVEHISAIEGMTPERFAENYMIDPDGMPIKPAGKRRGRRPAGYVEPLEA